MILFEKQENEALEFLARRDNWTEEVKNEMRAIHPWRRMCCGMCRYEYENYAFLKRHDEYGERIEMDADELLRGESYYRRQGRHIFSPCFYSGSVFDGSRNRFHPHEVHKALASLDSQLQAEKARYFVKNNTYDGHIPRYTFDTDLDDVFEKGSRMTFPASKRNPVGLNPERFVAKCESCMQWLLDCEFGTKFCEICENRKPSGNA